MPVVDSESELKAVLQQCRMLWGPDGFSSPEWL